MRSSFIIIALAAKCRKCRVFPHEVRFSRRQFFFASPRGSLGPPKPEPEETLLIEKNLDLQKGYIYLPDKPDISDIF
jgi:hypothetical protein